MPRRFLLLIGSTLLLLAVDVSMGQVQLGNQLPSPRLRTVTPCGNYAGTTFEVTLTGSDLDEPQALVFSHPGIKATFIAEAPPKSDPKVKEQKPPPPFAPKFKISIGDNVPVGHYDVRLVGKHGISNARTFVVGDLNERMEKEPNDDTNQAQRVPLNTTVTGVISQPDDVDYFEFAARKGQRVLVQCCCASIDSKLTPEMKMVDKDDQVLAAHRAAPLSDGFLDVTIPADGDYKVRLVQSAHLFGGPEAFYRLSITTGPWIDAVFPPIVTPGKTSLVTIFGRNLPGGQLDESVVLGGKVLEKLTITVTPPKDPAAIERLAFNSNLPTLLATNDGFEYRATNQNRTSNPALITYAQAPVVFEKEPNDTAESAQDVPVPCEIVGRMDNPHDRDWYSFTAKKGDVLMIELSSQRLGAPTDLYLVVHSAAGKAPVDMVLLDDTLETLNQVMFATSSRDPAPYRFVAPTDGVYHLMVGSHLTTSDVRHVYTLRIAPERPDFRLFVMAGDVHHPDACMLGAGGNQDLAVFVLRRDGFKGQVDVTVDGLPPGVIYQPQSVGPGVKQGAIVLNASYNAKSWTGTLTVKGTALIGGKKVEREARPAGISWPVPIQQGVPAVTRLERSLVLAVRGLAPYTLQCGIEKTALMHGGKVTIPVKVTRNLLDVTSPVQVVAVPGEMPPGVNFATVALSLDDDEKDLLLSVPANVLPGTYTFVFKSFTPMSLGNPKAKAANVVQCSTPVVVTVVPKQVAQVQVANPPPLKPGMQTELTVKVVRQFDYGESLKVKLILPPAVQGIHAEEVMIPAGQNEAKLSVHVANDAAPGPRNNLAVQVTAVIEGITVTQETRVNLNVTK